jgi:hypothetical protein
VQDVIGIGEQGGDGVGLGSDACGHISLVGPVVREK